MVSIIVAKMDASSLIRAKKIDIIDLIKKLYGGIIITETVYEEAVEKGMRRGYRDAYELKKIIDKGVIKVIKASGLASFSLGRGEAEVIHECIREKSEGKEVLFITDDNRSAKFAARKTIDVLGIDMVLLEAVIRGVISEEYFMDKIEELVELYPMDPSRLSMIFRILRIIREGEK